MRLFAALAASLLALSGCATAPILQPATYANPVLDADFPDPAVIRAGDGFYYAYATQTQRGGRWLNIQVARSADLVHWQHLGDGLPAKPAWASKTQDFWAPDVVRDGPRYIMYYSAKPDSADERHGLCLAVATAASPAGPFTDMGRPLKCGKEFANIDPMAFDDPATGKRLLYWGSGFEPLKVQELAPDRLSFAAGTSPKELVWPAPGRSAFPVLVEGSWVIRHGGFYYLFYSGDNCCGAKADYAVMVARSRSAMGPFETLEQAGGPPHSIVLQKRGIWFAPGHNSVITDAAGQDWMIYHAVDARRPREKATDEINTRRIMLIDRIRWENGWPVIDGPSSEILPAPVPAR
jgi:arabinan endo-1,5-alpha-L-arabinosidase